MKTIEEDVSKRLVMEVVDLTKTIWRRVSIDFWMLGILIFDKLEMIRLSDNS